MNIGIIGMGLIGGSFGKAILKRTEYKVYATDTSEGAIQRAISIDACHKELDDEDIPLLDMLIIALYPRSVEHYIDLYGDKLKSGCVVMDCSGTKRGIVDMMRKKSLLHNNLCFVGAHPMAGKEFCGIDHSSGNLYDKASMLLCPVNTGAEKLTMIEHFFLELGFLDVMVTTPDKHDSIIALTSQLAHVISNAYVKSPTALEHSGFSAGSFRDLTRVARNNYNMWGELMIDNRDNLVRELDLFMENINKYRKALVNENKTELEILLKEGSELKMLIDSKKKEVE